jgi:hypothetical protein
MSDDVVSVVRLPHDAPQLLRLDAPGVGQAVP